MLYSVRLIAVIIYFIFFCLIALAFTCLRPFNGNNTHTALKLLAPANWLMNLNVIILNQPKTSQPAVFIANHQDLLDVFLLAKVWPKNCSVVGKAELAWVPIFGTAFWLAGNIFINRGDKNKAWQVVEQVVEKINALNRSILIMPEGTRSQGKGLLPFKKGAFLTAIKAGVPIIPLCISSSTNITLNDLHPKPSLIQFLDPISTKGLTEDDAERLALECHEKMKASIKMLDQSLKNEF